MNIREGQIMGALFNFFVVKKCPFCIFWMLPSVSKIIPADTSGLVTTTVLSINISEVKNKIPNHDNILLLQNLIS